jgi:hypothetical protein
VLCFETLNLKGMQRRKGTQDIRPSFWRIYTNSRVDCQKERQAGHIYRSMVSVY